MYEDWVAGILSLNPCLMRFEYGLYLFLVGINPCIFVVKVAIDEYSERGGRSDRRLSISDSSFLRSEDRDRNRICNLVRIHNPKNRFESGERNNMCRYFFENFIILYG